MDIISPEILDKLLAYPLLLLVIFILWIFDRIIGKLIEVVKILAGMKER